MNCPTCNMPLAMTERSGVEIDYCPQCRGIWLDRGELDKIIERSAQEYKPAAPHSDHKPYDKPHYDKYADNRHYDPKRKKKDSFLGDLFDF
ncbi:MAG: zf-TFIIB domain-containing protein [Saprospiraceae bacterium]|nr:zf-TFIIB domain-containing protein [Saprospiraceae bacterium]